MFSEVNQFYQICHYCLVNFRRDYHFLNGSLIEKNFYQRDLSLIVLYDKFCSLSFHDLNKNKLFTKIFFVLTSSRRNWISFSKWLKMFCWLSILHVTGKFHNFFSLTNFSIRCFIWIMLYQTLPYFSNLYFTILFIIFKSLLNLYLEI